MNKRNILIVFLIFLMFASLSYWPRNIIAVNQDMIPKIEIEDGKSKELIVLEDKKDIAHILINFQRITFQRELPAISQGEYLYSVNVFDQNKHSFRKFKILSDETISYKGFFFSSKNEKIDYKYIDNLFEEKKIES